MSSRFLQHLGLKKRSPSLFLRVLRERMELILKVREEHLVAKILGSYHNEKFSEAVEWMNKVDRFLNETRELHELPYQSLWTESWCNDMLSIIRELRAKHGGPNFTFQKGRHVVGSSLSLHEEFYCEVRLLVSIKSIDTTYYLYFYDDDQDPQQRVPKLWNLEVSDLLEKIRLQLEVKIPATNSGWYGNKIEEVRTLIAKHDPPFLLHSDEDVVGSSKMRLLMLHEQLCCEIRTLVILKFVDREVLSGPEAVTNLENKHKKTLERQIKEVDQFLARIKLQLEEKSPKKDSAWYLHNISLTRMVITFLYPTLFHYRSQNDEDYCSNSKESCLSQEGAQNIVSPQDENVSSSINMTTDVGCSQEQYQIFLSFRGEDTRHNFTSFLYHALHEKGFKIFMDEERLHIGDSISNVITTAIENSKLSIIIFSQNFADSTWCLDEVVKILECREKKNQLVWPVFYKVEPSDVRHQRNNFETAMIKQKTKFREDYEKVNGWISALTQICDLKAFHYKEKENSRSEHEFIQGIVKAANDIRDHL